MMRLHVAGRPVREWCGAHGRLFQGACERCEEDAAWNNLTSAQKFQAMQEFDEFVAANEPLRAAYVKQSAPLPDDPGKYILVDGQRVRFLSMREVNAAKRKAAISA
jgi:hypothetical protein